jgi:hypothetical protein
MKKVFRHPLLFGTTSLILAAGGVYACGDFLSSNAAPQGTLDETTLANLAGVEGTLIAAYRAIDWNNGVGGNWGNSASNWVWGSVVSDDAYKGSEVIDQPAINDIEPYHWSTGGAEGYLNEKWTGVYEGVVRSNSTLRLLKRIVAEKPGAISEADAKGIEGEALFLRAHFHFEGWRMWGNIPYYREDETDFRKANETSAEVVTDLLKDLDAAIALLPETPRNGEIGRVTKWTAKAYKGRVEIYAGQFGAALTTLREVRASGPYALETSFDHVWSGFQEYSNGPETIFAYQASVNDGEPNGNNGNYGERLNFPHSGSPIGCCGFHQPSQNLVNFFATDAGTGLPVVLTDPANWNAPNATFTSDIHTPVDPRLDWTVGRDGVPYKDWGLHAPTWIRDPARSGPYSPKKNVHEKSSGAVQSGGGWFPQQQNSVNIHLFRYADMLLMLAEAEVEAGSLENARTIVNEIRARAAVRAQGPGTDRASIAVPINDPSITWAVYRIGLYPAFPSQAYARDAVRTERRLELAMEGQRFFDLKRWGIADKVLNAYLNGVAGGSEKARRFYLQDAEPFTSRHYLYPIPPIQIELSRVAGEDRLKQNPGW